MIPWVQLDSAAMPDGGGELRLKQRGAEFSIMLGATELMNSRLSGSEEALARLSCQRISDRPSPHVLIGGLGMGFTLRAALAELGDRAKITVAELVPAVVAWAHGPMAALFGACLGDPRVTVMETDVGPLIRSAGARYDAILLDVDNGPEGLTRRANDALYDIAGLAAAYAALKWRVLRLVVGARQRLLAPAPAGRVFGRGDQGAGSRQARRQARHLAGHEVFRQSITGSDGGVIIVYPA